ncbi:MAG: thiamine phosphate synthase [Hyphomicrobiales bacterium]
MNEIDLTLYGILDPERSLGRDLARLADEAISGGCTLLQLRDKKGTTRDMIARASAIVEAAAGRVPFLVNDRVDVAMVAKADGVHVGQDDMPVAHVRALMGANALVGLSVKTREEARNLPDGLDYICIGGVFDTQSKDNDRSIGVDGWKELAEIARKTLPAGMPIGAIAGIDLDGAKELTKAGADGVALISALFMEDNVQRAAREFVMKIEDAQRV